jgi:filamentous hemagglutinin family protein
MRRWSTIRSVMLASSALAPLGIAPAIANPNGPNVVGGAATVSGVGTSSVTVNQSSHRAIINWNTFNIGAGETTRFVQPSASSVALNRVTGNLGPSQLYGTLSANGRVFLVNPDGILVGRGAVIDTAGFLATTHDIRNDDFMAGRYRFNIPGRPDASVVNEGTINAHSHGFAALVAPGVRNSGTITAKFGKIGLAAGNGFSLDLYGDQLITLAVGDSVAATVKDVATGQPLGALVKNDGKLKANGGRVELTAASARAVVDSVINNSGVIEARSIGHRNGKIVLGGPTAATKVAGAPTQTVKVSGKLSTASKRGKGGTIQVTGEAIEIKAASFDASGKTGGGKVLIGGDTGGGHGHWAVASIPQAALEAGAVPTATTVIIDAATTINASATSVGDGGKVIVWADGDTSFSGNILARGGASSGNGGFAEVSGKQTLAFDGGVNVGASNGKSGTLLLDPLNAFIGTVPGPNVILTSSIQSALAFGDVVVTTNNAIGSEAGDLFVNAPITWGTEHNLWLTAYRNVVVNAKITNTFGGLPGGGNDKHQVILLADNTGTGVGTVTFGAGGGIKSSGKVNLVFNPSVNPAGSGVNITSYANPTENFTGHLDLSGGGVLMLRYLVNTPADLQNVQNAQGANYVLVRDIDMSNFAGFVPIANYTGEFSGLGHTVGNLTISSALGNVGLFGVIGASAEVNELSLFNFNVTGTGAARVGALAGTNNGMVENVDVFLATVTAASAGSSIGGLVGSNTGTIQHSSALVINAVVPNVTGGFFNAGGLVGLNEVGGTVRKSFSGAIIDSTATGGTISLGLLVGKNDAMVDRSWTFGEINALSPAASGGVIGTQGSAGTVNQVYYTDFAPSAGITGATGKVGGVVGDNENTSSSSVTSAYWNTDFGPANGIGTGSSGSLTGATGLTTAQLTSGNLPAGFNSSDWFTFAGISPLLIPPNPFGPFTGTILVANPSGLADLIPDEVRAVPDLLQNFNVIDKLQPLNALIQIKGPTTPATPPAGGSAIRPSQVPGALPAPSTPNFSTYSCATGTCFDFTPMLKFPHKSGEVIVPFPADISPAVLQQFAERNGLTVIERLNVAGNVMVQFRTPPGVSLDGVMRQLQQQGAGSPQPNVVFQLMQAQAPAAAAAPTVATARRGDPAQYMTGKLHLPDAHRLASGSNITVAVIDSDVDRDHAELAGTIAERFDATESDPRAHSHGTAMAGAIVSRDRLLGVAPGARILAVRAFSETQATAEATTLTILKGIEWAVSQGARVINMSFAGPYDPSLERALKDATARGVVLIAATGNAGPKSPPLWPGADPNVIAVTATDSGDKLFRQANRGPYVSVASPGVEILAPAPQAGYQMSTGTSIATAHVSGVVALMLERDPTLTPRDVRLILEATAKDLGPRGRDTQYGWGLVDPAKALAMVDERKRQKTSGASAPPAQR